MQLHSGILSHGVALQLHFSCMVNQVISYTCFSMTDYGALRMICNFDISIMRQLTGGTNVQCRET